MQNADTYFSNLHVSWLSCFAHSISCITSKQRILDFRVTSHGPGRGLEAKNNFSDEFYRH